MRATVLYGPSNVRIEQREDPEIIKPTDAIIRMAATCLCGSDLWPYRGIEEVFATDPLKHWSTSGGIRPDSRQRSVFKN